MTESSELLRFPIGKFVAPEAISPEQISRWIDEIEQLPARLAAATSGLTDTQLDTPYREGGWTLRQVVHHLADSHANAYIRFKLAVTEDHPTIRPYDEQRWAECEEARHAPVDVSLDLLSALHRRWVLFLRSLAFADFERTGVHPEHGTTFTLKRFCGLYAWHGEHHLHHILATKKSRGW